MYSVAELEAAKREASAKAIVTNPAIAGYAQLCDASGTYSVTEVAKSNGLTQTEMFNTLHAWRWLYKRGPHSQWLPYATVDKHLFVVKVVIQSRKGEKDKAIIQTRVTPEGLVRIATRLKRHKIS